MSNAQHTDPVTLGESIMSTPATDYSVSWVCECCLLMLANSDASGCEGYWSHGADTHPHATASLLPAYSSPGAPDSEHECGTPWDEREDSCGDEESTHWHASRQCDGCGGDFLPGATFHAVTSFARV